MYGLPEQDMGAWQKNLEEFLKFNIPHLSAYALTVEERTALHYKIRKERITDPGLSPTVRTVWLTQRHDEKIRISSL